MFPVSGIFTSVLQFSSDFHCDFLQISSSASRAYIPQPLADSIHTFSLLFSQRVWLWFLEALGNYSSHYFLMQVVGVQQLLK